MHLCNISDYQSNIPSSYNDPHEELKRCLLVYYRDRVNNDQGRNINSNGNQRYSSHLENNMTFNPQSSRSLLNINIDEISISKSTTILAEEDDEYEPLNEL